MTASKFIGFKGLLLAATILPGPLILASPVPARAQNEAVISCQIAPPLLPVYAQPPIPEEGYIWTPGYWAWAVTSGYYWVPGTWVLPPVAEVLWTPPYWGWSGGLYLFHGGYWGPQVGYYGGVNYGYGYGGSGYEGGRWEGGHFAYNQSVSNFGAVHVSNTYRQNVTVSNSSHVSYAGGAGGIRSEPTAGEREAEHQNHFPATAEQTRHVSAAEAHPGLVASHTNGRPAIAATSRPGEFRGAGVVRPQAIHAVSARQAAPQQAARLAPQHQAARPAPQHQAARPAAPQHQAARPAPQHQAARPAAPQQAARAAPRQVASRAPAEHGGGHEEKR